MIEWRKVVGYPSFEVSNKGQIVGPSGSILTPMMTGRKRKQYPTIRLSTKPRIDKKVHILVLEAFIGPCPEGMIGCHYDDNPKNNLLNNLYWGSHSENGKDKCRNTPNAERARQIKVLLAKGEQSQRSIACIYGVSEQLICDIKKKRRWAWV